MSYYSRVMCVKVPYLLGQTKNVTVGKVYECADRIINTNPKTCFVQDDNDNWEIYPVYCFIDIEEHRDQKLKSIGI